MQSITCFSMLARRLTNLRRAAKLLQPLNNATDGMSLHVAAMLERPPSDTSDDIKRRENLLDFQSKRAAAPISMQRSPRSVSRRSGCFEEDLDTIKAKVKTASHTFDDAYGNLYITWLGYPKPVSASHDPTLTHNNIHAHSPHTPTLPTRPLTCTCS